MKTKKSKIILGVLAGLIVVVLVAVVILGTQLGRIVRAGMETVGPKITQTTLTVSGVDVALVRGSAGVKGLVLGNPEGYQAPQSLSVSNVAVSLAPGSVFSDKLVVRSVEVRGLEVTFEGNPFGANNLTKIMANVQAFTGASAPATNGSPAASAAKGKKLEVDSLVIAGAKVHAILSFLGGREVTLPLPEIQLSALGTGPDGITPADLTETVLKEITVDTVKAVGQSAGNLGKGVLNGSDAGKLKEGLKGLFK